MVKASVMINFVLRNTHQTFMYILIWPILYALNTLIFHKNQQNLRTKAFIFAIRTKKGFIFSLRNILLLNEAFSFNSFKISRLWGKRKLNLRTENAFFKSVKNILVLNVAFKKSVLVLIKKYGCRPK